MARLELRRLRAEVIKAEIEAAEAIQNSDFYSFFDGDVGAIYSYKIRPEQTHDAYFAAVEAWLEERRAAGACAVQEAAAS